MRKPHLLHLRFDGFGDMVWDLECPYSATEVEDAPGRPCNLLEQNPDPPEGEYDEWEAWTKIPGCFARQNFAEWGYLDISFPADIEDPSFPLKVDVEIDGGYDDAYLTGFTAWKDDDAVQ